MRSSNKHQAITMSKNSVHLKYVKSTMSSSQTVFISFVNIYLQIKVGNVFMHAMIIISNVYI